MKLDRGSLAYGTAVLTAVGLFSQAVGFVYRIALSRMVGAETMGLYQLIMPVYSVLLSLTAVGLTVTVSTLSARAGAKGDRGAVEAVLRRCLGVFFALMLPLGAAVLLGSDPISVYLLGDARTRAGVMLLVPCVLLTGVENLHKHCFYGLGNVRPPALSETVEQLVRTAAVLGLLAFFLPQNRENTVGLIVLGMVCCEVFSAGTLILLFRRESRRTGARPGVPPPYREIFAIASPVGCTALLGALMGSANAVLIPKLLVQGGMEPSEAMSALGVLCGMTLPMLMLPTGFVGALCLVLVPQLARKAELGDRAAIRRDLDRVMKLAAGAMTPAMALLAVSGPAIGRLLYREETVGRYILPLAAGTLLSCYQSVLGGVLNGLGRQRDNARSAILSDGVQLGFTFFTVADLGLAGFAAGYVVSSAVGFGLNLWYTLRAAGGGTRAGKWFLAPTLAGVLAGLWTRVLWRVLTAAGMHEAVSAAVCVPAGIVLYLAAMFTQGEIGAAK